VHATTETRGEEIIPALREGKGGRVPVERADSADDVINKKVDVIISERRCLGILGEMSREKKTGGRQ